MDDIEKWFSGGAWISMLIPRHLNLGPRARNIWLGLAGFGLVRGKGGEGEHCQEGYLSLIGSVSRHLGPLFFHDSNPSMPRIKWLNYFRMLFDFAEIFECLRNSAVCIPHSAVCIICTRTTESKSKSWHVSGWDESLHGWTLWTHLSWKKRFQV